MRRVLVIDDDTDLRETLTEVLELEEWQVFGAANGQEALRVLEQNLVDVILLDFMMPVMDGGEFRVAQRARGDLASIPVVLASAACSMPETTAIEPDAVLSKPFSPEALLRCLDRIMRKRGVRGVG